MPAARRSLVLTGLRQLTWLNLGGCPRLGELAPLANLTRLEELYLNRCRQVRDLGALGGLTQITVMSLGGCHQVSDLGPLARLIRRKRGGPEWMPFMKTADERSDLALN